MHCAVRWQQRPVIGVAARQTTGKRAGGAVDFNGKKFELFDLHSHGNCVGFFIGDSVKQRLDLFCQGFGFLNKDSYNAALPELKT